MLGVGPHPTRQSTSEAGEGTRREAGNRESGAATGTPKYRVSPGRVH